MGNRPCLTVGAPAITPAVFKQILTRKWPMAATPNGQMVSPPWAILLEEFSATFRASF